MRAGLVVALAVALTAGTAPVHHWTEISDRTRNAAEDALYRFQRDGDPGSGRAAAAFQNARLDDPFYYFSCDASLWQFPRDPSNDLMPYLVWRDAMFPVVVNDDAIGVLKVREMEGDPTAFFVPVPSGIYDKFKTARRRVRLGRDQQLSVLNTMVGDFFIVEDGTHIASMAPCTTRTLLLLRLPDPDVESASYRPPDEMAPLIKDAIRERR